MLKMSNKMKEHLKESLRILKDHCINRDNCEGCELGDVCECLFWHKHTYRRLETGLSPVSVYKVLHVLYRHQTSLNK